MLISIIIPTYNEKENIAILIPRIMNVINNSLLETEIVIVDGSSPDGTGNIAIEMKKKYSNIRVLILGNKKSLSYAVIKGFEISNGDILLVMDADLSHPVEKILKLIEPIRERNCDMTIASRYVKGGGEEGRLPLRRIISKVASILARTITDVKDPMSNFFALKRNVIEGIKLKPKRYRIALEIIAKGNYNNIIEIPYVFKERKYGNSKFSNYAIIRCLFQLISLLFAKNSLFRNSFYSNDGNRKN